MKRIFGVLAIMLVLVMLTATTMSATALYVVPNPKTTVPYATPAVDGKIDPGGEGYSVKVALNDETCGYFWAFNPMTTAADLYYAFDDEGLYVAAIITEGHPATDMNGFEVGELNQFNYSTAFDVLDLAEDESNQYGWNGDVMGIMVDPFGSFIAEGFGGGADKSAWYMVGLFEGDVARVYKSQTSTDGEITDLVKAAGYRTEAGWNFELMIPWDMIIADTYDCSMGFIEIKSDELVKKDAYLRVGAMYHDRFFDDEQGEVATWGRYIVIPEALPDGTPGNIGVGENIASYGIELVLGEVPDPDPDPEPPPPPPPEPDSETKDIINGAGTDTDAPQTVDIALATATGALAASCIGIMYARKKR